jgi:hypothetical protein
MKNCSRQHEINRGIITEITKGKMQASDAQPMQIPGILIEQPPFGIETPKREKSMLNVPREDHSELESFSPYSSSSSSLSTTTSLPL